MSDKHNQLSGPTAQGFDAQVLLGLMHEIRNGFAEIQLAHERNTNTERRLVEHEDRSVAALTSLEAQVVRVHERLDEMRSETTGQITTALTPVSAKILAIEISMTSVRSDLDGWINRGKGAWFVASIFAAVFQGCIVAALLWALNEVKLLHDWRISVEAVQRQENKRNGFQQRDAP